jgi:hypothetical protein
MLSTIRLHHQLPFMAVEIEDIFPHRNLPTKLEPAKPTVSQNSPQSFFRVRRFCSHSTSEFQEMFWRWRLVRFGRVLFCHESLLRLPLTPALSRRERGPEGYSLG